MLIPILISLSVAIIYFVVVELFLMVLFGLSERDADKR